ncbi:hypothetical protein LCGC14_2959320, partial [marine sediment metagenome]
MASTVFEEQTDEQLLAARQELQARNNPKWATTGGVPERLNAEISRRGLLAPTDLGEALEQGGFYTAGFTGSTPGEYQEWYQEEFGLDPFALAEQMGGGEGSAAFDAADPSLA